MKARGNRVVLHLHRSLLVVESPFFSAQLSERWAADCTERDEQDRPVYSLKGCRNSTAYADTVEKLYKMAHFRTREDRPGEAFSSFDDAVRCIIPADRLGLGAVSRAAVRYLEHVAWRTLEEKATIVALAGSLLDNPAVNGLIKRLVPPTKDEQAELWEDLVQKACPLLPPQACGKVELSSRDRAREFITTSLLNFSKSAPGASSLLHVIRKRLGQLKDEILPLLDTPRHNVSTRFTGAMSSLKWILRLSLDDVDIRVDVADLLASLDVSKFVDTSVNAGAEARGIDNCVFLLEAVADGGLVLGSCGRTVLLKIVIQWAVRNITVGTDSALHAKEGEILQGPFSAALATLEWTEQNNLLAPWRPQLMQTWQPWFTEWLKSSLVPNQQILKVGNTSALGDCTGEEHPTAPKMVEESKDAPKT